MDISIEHIDTFMLLRGILGMILGVTNNPISSEVNVELHTIIRKMDEADLKTDSNGYFIKEDK